MIFHENRLLADDSHEISYLIFSKNKKDVAKMVVCCSRDWRLRVIKGYSYQLKGVYLSKALTCMNFFLYKKICFFIKETDTFGHIVV